MCVNHDLENQFCTSFPDFRGVVNPRSRSLSRTKLDAVYLRVDTIEQALRNICSVGVTSEGYHLAYRIAKDNLRLGLSVVADSCNPIELTRREWEQAAREAESDYINIEVICSDVGEHRARGRRGLQRCQD